MDMQCLPVPKLRDEAERVYLEAVDLFAHKSPSIENIERHLRPGYALAARVMARMEAEKLVSAPQAGGVRVWFGPGADGRKKFKEFAESLKAKNEPAAHWWDGLTEARRGRVLPGASLWGDLSEGSRATVRLAYWKQVDKLRALQREFRHMPGWQYTGAQA